MLYVWLIIGLGIVSFLTGKFIKHKSLFPFMPFRYDFRKRRDFFKKALKLLDDMKAKVIVETGTSRLGLKSTKSNGAFTIVFGKWAKLNNAMLHSVDINETSVSKSQAEVNKQKLTNNVKVYLSDSVEFLKEFKEPIDFLYLDSFDYSFDPEILHQCHLHHLNEFKSVEHLLHKDSFVIIDDCGLPNGGKGKLAIEYMLSKGWKILMEEYQVLLVRDHFKEVS